MSKTVRISAAVIALIAGAVLVSPWALYWWELRNVDGRPAAPANTRSAEEVNSLWVRYEPALSQKNLGDISPYWAYYIAGCSNDLFPCHPKGRFGGLSQMAGFVAKTYLDEGHFTGKGQLQRHLTGLSLAIWIQRTMSPADLVNAYIEMDSHDHPLGAGS